jgi:hypothetical protein
MKNKVVLVIVVGILLVGGIFYFRRNPATKPEETKPSPTPEEVKTEEQKEGIFGSIREALEKSISLKCQYQLEEGDKVTVYLKGKDLIRAEVLTKQNHER